MEQLTVKTGKSFQPDSIYKPIKDPKRFIEIGKVKARTSAQAMTAIAYGDSDTVGIPFRNLDFNTKCEDYHDLAACIKIIDSYNEFDADTILKQIPFILNLQHYLNEGNPNNGKSLFDFEIGREGSPSFYIGWNEYYNNKRITDYEIVNAKPATETEPAQPSGRWLFWEEYTADQFKQNMELLAATIKADEIDIEENDFFGKKSFKARFWFD